MLVFAAMLALDLRDPERVRDVRGSADRRARARTGSPPRLPAEALAGYVDVLDGRTAAGIARIRRALDETRGADHAPGDRAS